MKILVVAHRPPVMPLVDGYALQLHHLLNGLGEHRVRLVSDDARRSAVALDDHVEFIGVPVGEVRLGSSPRALRRLGRATNEHIDLFQPDVVHIAGNLLAPLIRVIGREAPVVLGALDAPFLNAHAGAATAAERLRRKLKVELMMRAVRGSYARFDRVVVVSDADKEALLAVDPGMRVVVIPNGVDANAYAQRPGDLRNEGELLFTGALRYGPNVEAASFLVNDVLPLIRRSAPSARLRLVGRDPTPRVVALGQNIGVEVVGTVPEMTPELSRASVYVCPMVSGTGIKNKLLEAMANGLPCVATQLATQGLSVEAGRHLLIADTAGGIAEAVLHLLSDRGMRDKLGEAARKQVLEHHSWEAVVRSYSAAYQELI